MARTRRTLPVGYFAHATVRLAINIGEIPPARETGPCWDCGRPAELYDHRDYTRPLDLEPVCRKCNRRRGAAHPYDMIYKSQGGHPNAFRGKHVLRAFKNSDHAGVAANLMPAAKPRKERGQSSGSYRYWSADQMAHARESLLRAIAIMGSRENLARALGISGAAVGQWKICPEYRVDAVVAAVEQRLKEMARKETPDRYSLCPEAFGGRPD